MIMKRLQNEVYTNVQVSTFNLKTNIMNYIVWITYARYY